MAIAATPSSTAISAGSKEAPRPAAPENRWPPKHPLPKEFLHTTFTSLDEFRGVHLLKAPLGSLSSNELSRRGEFKVARIAMRVLEDRVSEITVIGWQGKRPEDVESQRDVRVRLKDGSEFDIEVKNGGKLIQRQFMRNFRDGLPEDERNTREARNKAMWAQRIMMVISTGTDEEIAASIQSQHAEIIKLTPVDVFVAEPTEVDIGQLAFSGTANPDDAPKWIAQNPQ